MCHEMCNVLCNGGNDVTAAPKASPRGSGREAFASRPIGRLAKAECPSRDRNNRHPACPKLPQSRITVRNCAGGARKRTWQRPNHDCPGGRIRRLGRPRVTTRVRACPKHQPAIVGRGRWRGTDTDQRLECKNLSIQPMKHYTLCRAGCDNGGLHQKGSGRSHRRRGAGFPCEILSVLLKLQRIQNVSHPSTFNTPRNSSHATLPPALRSWF